MANSNYDPNGKSNFFLKIPAESYQRDTDKARCFDLNDQSIWIPKSQIVYYHAGEEWIEMTLPTWLVKEKGLDIYADKDWVNAGMPD